jgi:21S rRNA (GM2251-2'-O)-methyltransferase
MEPTLAERLQGEAVFGLNPVREALRTGRRQLYRMWVQEGSDASFDSSLLTAAKNLDVAVETVSKHDLNMLTGSPP